MIDAKLKGEGIPPMDEEEPDRDNVIDLMAALRQSLGQDKKTEKTATEPKKAAPKKSAAKSEAKRSAPRKRA